MELIKNTTIKKITLLAALFFCTQSFAQTPCCAFDPGTIIGIAGTADHVVAFQKRPAAAVYYDSLTLSTGYVLRIGYGISCAVYHFNGICDGYGPGFTNKFLETIEFIKPKDTSEIKKQ